MTGFALVSFHHAPNSAHAPFEQWLEEEHLPAMRGLRGFVRILPFRVSAFQLLPDQPQPWPALLIHEFSEGPNEDQLERLVQSLAGMPTLTADRDCAHHVFQWITPWRHAPAFPDPNTDISHMIVVMANASPGQDAAYNAWYDNYHMPETLAAPGAVAMRRGKLSVRQLDPETPHPAGYLVLVALQTDDVAEVVGEMGLRSVGRSKSGIAFTPRSEAVSNERTIHLLESDGAPLS